MNRTSRFGFFILAVAGGLLLASCASTGVKRNASAASILDSKMARLTQFDALLATLHNSLAALEQSAAADPRKPYGTLDSTTKKLSSQAGIIKKEADSMDHETRKRFDLWGQEIATIQDEELRGNAEKRREDEMAKSKEIEASLYKVVEAYEPLESKLKDLHTALDNDLNAAGIASASKLIGVVKQDTEDLQRNIREMVKVIDKVSSETSPRAPAKVPAPAKTETEKTESKEAK